MKLHKGHRKDPRKANDEVIKKKNKVRFSQIEFPVYSENQCQQA